MTEDKTPYVGQFTIPRLDKRLEPRASTTALAVRTVGDCQSIYGYARDISRSGMQIRTFSLCDSPPKEVGEQINILFRLPDKVKDIEFGCRATVMWNGVPPEGPDTVTLQGVKFRDIDPSSQDRIDNWIST